MGELASSYPITGADGKSAGSRSMFHAAGVMHTAKKFTDLMGVAWTNDDIEGQDVLKRADNDCMADKGYFKERIKEIKDRKDKAVEAFNQVINTHFATKLNLMDDLMHAQAPKWFGVGEDVATQHSYVVKHLHLDEWQSKGAKDYKSAIESQKGAMVELRDISRQNGIGLQQVAELNGNIFLAVMQTINEATNNWETGVANSHGASGLRINEARTGQDYYDRTYYQRSDIGSAQMEYVTKWITELVSSSGAWSGTAIDINSQLEQVRTSGANLGTMGKWPPAKAGTGVGANSGDLGDNETGVDSGESNASAEGTLDK